MVSSLRRRGQLPCRSQTPSADPHTQVKLKKLVDGGGLQLWVQPSGARLWRLAYRFAGKQKLLALGVYPSCLLAKARQARDEAKRLLAQGLDPSNERKQRAQAKANAPTFRALADEYLAKLKREARAAATLTKTEWLLAFAKAEFGDEPHRECEGSDGPSGASEVRGTRAL